MATLAQPARPATFAVLQNRAFTRLWASQLISTMGNTLTSVAAAIVVFRLTNSAFSVGLLMIVPVLPSLLLGLVAGVFVDRCDRRRLMIGTNLVRAGLIGLIPLLLPLNVAWLYVLVLLSSSVGQAFDPAHASLLPELASDEELAAASALTALSAFGAQALGFGAAALLAASFPVEWAFYLDALSFVLSAACLLGLRVAALPVSGRTTVAAVAHNLHGGVRFIAATPILRSLFLVYLPVFICFGLGNTILLPFVHRALQGSEFDYSLIACAETVGFAAGSLLMARLSDRLPVGRWIAVSFLGMGLAGVGVGQTGIVPLALVGMVVAGLANAPSVVGRQLIVQRTTPREIRGRVNSAFFVTRDTMYMIGMAIVGLADVIDVRLLYSAGELVIVGAGLLVLVLPGLGQPLAAWRRVARLWIVRSVRHVRIAPPPVAIPVEAASAEPSTMC